MTDARAARTRRREAAIVLIAAALLLAAFFWGFLRHMILGPCACTQSPSPTGTPAAVLVPSTYALRP